MISYHQHLHHHDHHHPVHLASDYNQELHALLCAFDYHDRYNHHTNNDDHDNHVQVLHALLRAVHQEGERTVEKEIPQHAGGDD